ncbi:facilitated trehalose transporter Tret1 [Diachasma alloeum]|uniref:facilitated trehalose transporter Tret1 n=1 Tax=Diachasma alloeum TaxID=454923 RepID=UPI0007382DAB|nr:facilitated trehalose transporter Tret1 [Diachasma alloeum]
MFMIKNTLLIEGSWPQWIAAFEIFLMSFVVGLERGWTSPALAILLSSTSPMSTTESEGSWIASLLNIGRGAGAIIGAIDVELVGSKTSALHIGIVQTVSFISLGLADSAVWIQVSRLIGGLATGMFFISFPLYIGEISNPIIRGALVGVIANGMSIGYVVGNLTGAYMSIPMFAAFALAVTVLFLITFYWLPKSPHYLVLTDQVEEASAAIRWYQRNADVPNELTSLQMFIKDKRSMTYKNLWNEFMRPHNRIALIKVNTLYVLMQLSGLYTVGFYMEIILTKGEIRVIAPAMAVIVISSIGLVGGWIALFTIDKYGRKLVLSAAAVGLGTGLVGIAIHYQLLEVGFDPASLQWLIIASIILLEMSINLGIIPIPSTILSEIFSPNIKSYCSCISNITSGFVAFLVTQTYQMLIDWIDYYTYYLYALMMFLLALFMMTMMPETKGKSLQEIQNMLLKK